MPHKKSSLSKSSSYNEIGDFWDSHDIMDSLDDTMDVEFEIDIASNVNYFPIVKSISDQLRLVAQKEGVSPTTLINLWLQEKLKELED